MEKKNIFRCKKKPSQVKYKVILNNYIYGDKLSFLVLLRRPTKVTFFFSYMDRYTIQVYLCGGLGPEILNIELQCVSFRISKFTHKSKHVIIQ